MVGQSGPIMSYQSILLIWWMNALLLNTKALKVSDLAKLNDRTNLFVQYKFEDVVPCLELMSDRNERHHFVFMGDSRIRHLFYSFVQVMNLK